MVPTPGEVVDVLRRAWTLTAPAIQRTAGDAQAAAGKPDRYSLPKLGAWAAAGRAIPEPAAEAERTPETRRVIYQRPKMLADRSTHYCPGCGHGIIHRLVAELLDEMHLGPTHDRGRLGRLQRVRLRLPGGRLRRVAPRPGARPSRPASGGSGPTRSCSPTRATATWRRSARPRSSMPRPAANGSASSSSTTASTA